MAEVLFGRTAKGQMLYDFGFSKLTEKWLARKYRMSIAEVRKLKATARAALNPKRKKRP